MANPNIVNVSTIFGKTFAGALTTSDTTLLSNSAASGTIYKINTIFVSNVDGTNAAEVTISVGTSTYFPIASTITVPSDSTLVVSSKDTSFYLEEGWVIRGFASANSDLTVVISYEVIS
jgi:hypothetical protein